MSSISVFSLIEKSESVYVDLLKSEHPASPTEAAPDEALWEIAEGIVPRDALKVLYALLERDHDDLATTYLAPEDMQKLDEVLPPEPGGVTCALDMICYLARRAIVSCLQQRRDMGEAAWRERMRSEMDSKTFSKLPFFLPEEEGSNRGYFEDDEIS